MLDRLGEDARPALPAMKQRSSRPLRRECKGSQHLPSILKRTIAVLEGKTQPLVYP